MHRNTITAAALFALVLPGCTSDNLCFGKFADPACIATLIHDDFDGGDAPDGDVAQGIDAERPPLPDFSGHGGDMRLVCPPGLQADCRTDCGTVGTATCELGGWGPCVPPIEKCNGIDDNCNGKIDEGFDCIAGEEKPCVFKCSTPNAVQTCDSAKCTWSACHDRSVDPGCGLCNPVMNTGCAPAMAGECKNVICNFNENQNGINELCDAAANASKEGERCGAGDCLAGLGCYAPMGGLGICREVCDLRRPVCQNGRPCTPAKGSFCYGWCV